MLSAKWRQFYLGFNVLKIWRYEAQLRLFTKKLIYSAIQYPQKALQGNNVLLPTQCKPQIQLMVHALLCFVVVKYHNILQIYWTDTREIIWIPQRTWNNIRIYG